MSAALPASAPDTGLLTAPAAWHAVDLISDLHLQAAEMATFEAWRHYMAHTSAQAVLILGDLFEVWVGDDSVAHEPFLQRCAEVLRLASQRLHVAFMPGNRDFLVGPGFLADCGVQPLSDPTLLELGAQRVLLSHGDALCLQDKAYQDFRQQVRSTSWQRDFLARALNERLALARNMRAHSELQKRTAAMHVDADEGLSLQWLAASRATRLIHGHTHHPADHRMGTTGQAIRHVLSDWSLDHPPARAQALRLHRDGQVERLDLLG